MKFIGVVVLFFLQLVLQDSESKDVAMLAERELLDYVESRSWNNDPIQLEKVGLEIIRRKSIDGHDLLLSEFDWLASRISEEDEPQVAQTHLILLSLLRKFKGQPLPIDIIVEQRCDTLVSRYNPPKLSVFIKNVDVEKQDIFLPVGSEYHFSGQNGRIGIQQTSGLKYVEKGGVSVTGGGRIEMVRLSYGQHISYPIDLADYFELHEDGSHAVEFIYHSTPWIDVKVLMKSTIRFSTVFRFDSAMMSTLDTEGERKLRDAAQDIPCTGPVMLLENRYGDWAFDYISPNSPCGVLLQAGTAAMPYVLERLKQSKDPFVRAWCLAILYNITNCHHPETYDGEKLLGNYIRIYKGVLWTIGKPNDEAFRVESKGKSIYSWYGDKYDRDPRDLREHSDWSKHRIELKSRDRSRGVERSPDILIQSQLIPVWQSELTKLQVGR